MTDGPDVIDMAYYPLRVGDTLAGHEWIELRHQRLLGSRWRTVMTATPEAGFFGFLLWLEALRQDPAGSLPDDDDELAMLAGLGRDVDRWRDLRTGQPGRGALYGWHPCLAERPDGTSERRLMHRTVAEIAVEAFARVEKWRARSQDATRRKQISRVKERMRLTPLRASAARSDQVAGAVLDWLAGRRMAITAENVRSAVEEISKENVVHGVDFSMK